MSGRAPREKGSRVEREFVNFLQERGIDAERVPLSGEKWRLCPRFPHYIVSEYGNVKRIKDGKNKKAGDLISVWLSNRGYWYCTLSTMGKKKHCAIHRLVLEAFVGPADAPNLQCAHNDGDQTNNHYTNLRWATSKENQADKAGHGTALFGSKHHQSRLNPNTVREIRVLHANGVSARVLGKRFGVCHKSILNVIHGKTWSHVR